VSPEKVGSGAFGEIWQVANVGSGRYMAVKRIKLPDILSPERTFVRREIETISRISRISKVQANLSR
jgi:serine/threonine protein kinase